jgi:hypothetical protein
LGSHYNLRLYPFTRMSNVQVSYKPIKNISLFTETTHKNILSTHKVSYWLWVPSFLQYSLLYSKRKI